MSNRSSQVTKRHQTKAQNVESSFCCVARRAVLLKPNVANILLFNFCEQKFVQYGPITIAIDCNGFSLPIFEEKWSNYASRPKSTPNSDLFWVCWLLNVCVRVFCAPNATILLDSIAAQIKMSFILKDDFFFAKIGRLQARCSSVYTAIFVQRKDKANYL